VEQELVTISANRFSRATQEDTPIKPRYPVSRACATSRPLDQPDCSGCQQTPTPGKQLVHAVIVTLPTLRL
jgi:hypothetical protein